MAHKDIINPDDFIDLGYLNKGGQAIVEKVIDKRTNKLFVAKIYNSNLEFTFEEDKKQLESEINTMRRLNHPLIVKFIGFSPIDFNKQCKPVIFLEYMENLSIDHQLSLERNKKAKKKWDDTRKLICIYAISSVMKYLHSQKIIHCDIKPHNVLLDEDFNPKISDFGLCKLLNSKIGSNTDSNMKINGTPVYMAPEMIKPEISGDDNVISEKSDVYAFAITVYEIITGQKPYKSISLGKLLNDVPKGIRPEFNTEIPESYKNLIERCWKQDPKERPTFEQITQELRENPDFITSSINSDEYFNFIEKIEESDVNFSISKSNIYLDEFIKNVYNYDDSKSSKDTEKSIDPVPDSIKPENLDADDLLQLANKYYNGDGVSVDKQEGIRYYKLAADKGNVEAMHKYGKMLKDGTDVDINKKESARYFKMAADKGFIKSMISYGLMLYFDDGIEIDENEAVKYFKLAADKDDTDGIYLYGFALISGKGIKEDLVKGADYLKKAADKNNIEAMFRYAFMLEIGLGIPSDKKEALKYYKKAADKGHVISMYQYAVMLDDCDGIPPNKEEAANYYKFAADRGHYLSMYQYAVMLNKGDGIAENKEEAAKYFKYAADNGHINSMFLYAQMNINGDGIKKNEKEAAKYFKMGADKNDSEAKIQYGYLLIKGIGVEKQPKKGLEMIRDVAEQGNMNVVYIYAYELYTGKNVQQDKRLAAQYFKLAANNGNVDSMFIYANMLKTGEGGININLQERARYLKMAADKGHTESMYQYGLMREKGEGGLKPNHQMATQYIKKAANNGNIKAKNLYNQIIQSDRRRNADEDKPSQYSCIIA